MTTQHQINDHINQIESLADQHGFDFVWGGAIERIVRVFEKRGMSQEQAVVSLKRMANQAKLYPVM